MHEASHWLLFPQARLNTRVGVWLCGAPVGADLKAYRRRHHLHHRHTQQAEDPDLALSAGLPVSRARFARSVLSDLGGWTALTRVAGSRRWRDGVAGAWRGARTPLLGNAVLFCALAAIGGWPLYLLVWALPWATWFQLVTRVRDIAEHGMVPEADDPLRNTRSIRAGFGARAFLAPYWVNYHLEHHLLVFVPCWKLRQVHAVLLGKDLGPRMERAASYMEVLARAVPRVSRGTRSGR
jgi:fatty acid desaturase